MKTLLSLFVLTLFSSILISCNESKDQEESSSPKASKQDQKVAEDSMESNIEIKPISHASFVIKTNNMVLYNDPVGNPEAYADQPQPDVILLSDIHPDHLNIETLEHLAHSNLKIIVPQAVADSLPERLLQYTQVMKNGESSNVQIGKNSFSIKAIPMYNLRKEALKFHEKGRGNGYLLTLHDQRIYISGDTEDIPEMRQLKNIDIAFVCMNLPYTMPVEHAAEAVLDFAPKKVYPYHYRGKNGLSDVDQFKSIVNENNPDIEVIQLDWYPKM